MTFVAVLPSIYEPWTELCMASMCNELAEATMVVDNAKEANLGVAASWNRGVDRALDENADWLVVVSASMRFWSGVLPKRGGDDYCELLRTDQNSLVVEAGHGIGWHLVAFRRQALLEVGPFDEVFFAYYEDIDWARRFHLNYNTYGEPLWRKVSVDVSMAGFAHGIDLGRADVSGRKSRAAYVAKWGGDKGAELWRKPYNDESLGMSFTGRHAG